MRSVATLASKALKKVPKVEALWDKPQAYRYEQHSVSVFLTDNSKTHNKLCMVTLISGGACSTTLSSFPDLRPAQNASYEGGNPGGGLEQCCATLAAKLKKGYTCRAIGVSKLVSD